MTKVVPFLIFLCLSFQVAIAQQKESCWDRSTSEAARSLGKETVHNATVQNMKGEEQRNQLMGLTITVLVGLLGFAFSKGNKDFRTLFLIVAILFCLFMHALDTILLDSSNRQIAYGNELNNYLLKWHSLTQDEMKLVLNKVDLGNEPNDSFQGQKGWIRKTQLFFWAGMFRGVWWYGLTFGVVVLMIWDWQNRKRSLPPLQIEHSK